MFVRIDEIYILKDQMETHLEDNEYTMNSCYNDQ